VFFVSFVAKRFFATKNAKNTKKGKCS
jgi:hypothetical protein